MEENEKMNENNLDVTIIAYDKETTEKINNYYDAKAAKEALGIIVLGSIGGTLMTVGILKAVDKIDDWLYERKLKKSFKKSLTESLEKEKKD